MKKLGTKNQTILDMSCYQFALYGGENGAILKDIGDRFCAIGDYLFSSQIDNTKVLQNVSKDTLDEARKISNSNRPIKILEILCIEFGFEIDKSSDIKLCGLIRNGQMTPEHMWICSHSGDFILYDTMPGSPIRKSLSNNFMSNPPSEGAELNTENVYSIGVRQLTNDQKLIILSDQWN